MSHLKAKYAALMDHFHLTPAQIGNLTDRQIQELYFHPRDRQTGAIQEQPEPVVEKPVVETPPDSPRRAFLKEMMAFDVMASQMRLPEDNIRVCKARIRAKYGISETPPETAT